MMNGPVKWHFFRKNLVKLVLQYIRKQAQLRAEANRLGCLSSIDILILAP